MTRTGILLVSLLALAHALCAQPFEVSAANSARYLGSGHWEWTVYLVADPGALSQIHCVEYKLPSTFPSPNREVCQRGSAGQPFALTAEGYGELNIHLRIRYNNSKTQDFDHDLKLVDTRCPSPLDQFTLKEGETHVVKGIIPPVYVYADEIHEKTDSHFRLFRTSRPLPQPRQVPEFLKRLKKLHSEHGLVLDLDTYLKFNLSPARGRAEMAVAIGPKETMGLLVSDPSSRKTINIRVCK